MAITRTELRRAILDTLGDIVILDRVESGTDTTAKDSVNLYQPDNHFKGSIAYFASGTSANLGLSRSITGSNASAATITFTPPLPAAVAANDVIEIINERSLGWTIPEVHRAINRAINHSWPMAKMSATLNSSALFAQASPVHTIPSSLEWLHTLEYLDNDGLYRPIHRARSKNGHGYTVNRANGTVTISGNFAYLADGKTLRFHGYSRPVELAADSDSTTVDPEWLIARSMSELLGSGIHRVPERERLFNYWGQREVGLRSKLNDKSAPNGEWCREV